MNEEKKLVPKLRFPEFRGAEPWRPIELGEASTPVTERVGERKLIPVSISAGIGFVPQAEKFGRDISGNQYQLYTLVKDGDFVYNKGNSLKFPEGCVYILQGWGQVAAPNVFICFRLKDGYSNGFFQNCFEANLHGKQLKRHITSGARSNGLLNISKDAFFGVEIPTPTLQEQQKIADCLSSLDELIAAQARKVDALKTHKKGLMQQLFPREGETQPRLRFPEFRDAGEWEKRKVSSLLARSVNPVSVESEEMYREIGIRSHGKGIFHKEPLLGKALGDKRVFHVEKNAFILNIVFAWEQAVAVTSSAEIGMIASHRFPMYKPNEREADVYFIKYFFLTNKGKELLGIASPGGAGRNKTLGQKDFEKLEFFCPRKIEEQTAIALCLSSADTLITAAAQELETLKTHKKGLMQQLFPSAEAVAA